MKITEAIKSFEKIFGCRISLHDYTGNFRAKPGMREYSSHFNPFCDYVKSTDIKNLKSCVAMDAELLRKHFSENPVPVFKMCHAGVLELCVPVMSGNKLIGAMFAGPFHPVKEWFHRTDLLSQKRPFGAFRRFEKLAAANLKELKAENFSELLNFAILLASYLGISVSIQPQPLAAYPPDKKILLFFDREFTSKDVSLEKLASFLNLGLSRTSQLLKKHFNRTFSEILMEKRMDSARYLLKETFLRTEYIARTCGFSASSYFFRVFKSHNAGLTPNQYRKKERTFSIEDAETKI